MNEELIEQPEELNLTPEEDELLEKLARFLVDKALEDIERQDNENS